MYQTNSQSSFTRKLALTCILCLVTLGCGIAAKHLFLSQPNPKTIEEVEPTHLDPQINQENNLGTQTDESTPVSTIPTPSTPPLPASDIAPLPNVTPVVNTDVASPEPTETQVGITEAADFKEYPKPKTSAQSTLDSTRQVKLTNGDDIKRFLHSLTLTGIGPKGVIINDTFVEWGGFYDATRKLQVLGKENRSVIILVEGTKYKIRF